MNLLTGNQIIVDLIDRIRSALPPGLKLYLVGGAVRDLVSGRKIHDLDFLLIPKNKVIPLARKIADNLHADFYPLDKERDTARLIFMRDDGVRLHLDFAALRDEGLLQDLKARDFTVNSMAIDTDDYNQLIDPLEGTKDIHNKIIRASSIDSMLSDPLRILRAVRLAVQLDYKISPDTLLLMKQAMPELIKISPERQRDEIFRLLSIKRVDTSLRVLEKLGILPTVFPELTALVGLQQSSPHTLDVWNHTLSVVQKLEQILFILGLDSDLEESGNIVSSWISLKLGRYRKEIADHFSVTLNPDRSIQSLLFLAAIYHDAGKAETQSIGAQGEFHFYRHEKFSQEKLEQRARFFRLSNQEIERLSAIASAHLRPLNLNQSSEVPSRRAIYKFWRDLDDAGVDVCLLSIADLMGTYGLGLPNEKLISHLTTIRSLLDAWWVQREELVSPPSVLNGNQLMNSLQLEPGPLIGKILEAIRQAQVDGLVSDSQEALAYARSWLDDPQEDY